jgi:hypothetical protein
VTFGGSPDSAFTAFLAMFVVSVALQKMVQRAPAPISRAVPTRTAGPSDGH